MACQLDGIQLLAQLVGELFFQQLCQLLDSGGISELLRDSYIFCK